MAQPATKTIDDASETWSFWLHFGHPGKDTKRTAEAMLEEWHEECELLLAMNWPSLALADRDGPPMKIIK